LVHFKDVSNILWDFDGVIMDSMAIRDKGFLLTLDKHPKHQVDMLMEFHRQNGGLSRYVKFRYFFSEILKEEPNENTIKQLAQQFSDVMLKELLNPELLIDDSLNFIKRNFSMYNMHIISGSDGIELMSICSSLGLTKYFKSIHGSPKAKDKWVKEVIEENHYNEAETILIGDSHNDLAAANENNICFYGYNNANLKGKGNGYINNFTEIIF
jgi:phosphoglycolate phosphatase-like HAD superfamily hydrolase